ncbi:hypothetical protein [Streptomyces sp. bgisy100]|uniref:hypothetical protein n=1 Tax=Streptomyces sp. bgisy100 TaxID=3413783 RepID=UPI003D7498E1
MSSIGTAADAQRAAGSVQGSPHSRKYGKRIYLYGSSPGCRIMASVKANRSRATGYLKATCKDKSFSTISGALSLNNQDFKKVGMRTQGKSMTTKRVSFKNRRGTQKFCMMGWWMHPLYPEPHKRSEAKACVKY